MMEKYHIVELYNHQTKQFESIHDLQSMDVSALIPYLPLNPAAPGLFQCYADLGVPVLQAFMAVSYRCIGRNEEAGQIVAEFIAK